MSELDDLRVKINEIDKEIVNLYIARLDTILSIGDFKRKNNIPVLDANRETQVLDNIAKILTDNGKEEYTKDVISLYKYIMDYSKTKQQGK